MFSPQSLHLIMLANEGSVLILHRTKVLKGGLSEWHLPRAPEVTLVAPARVDYIAETTVSNVVVASSVRDGFSINTSTGRATTSASSHGVFTTRQNARSYYKNEGKYEAIHFRLK